MRTLDTPSEFLRLSRTTSPNPISSHIQAITASLLLAVGSSGCNDIPVDNDLMICVKTGDLEDKDIPDNLSLPGQWLALELTSTVNETDAEGGIIANLTLSADEDWTMKVKAQGEVEKVTDDFEVLPVTSIRAIKENEKDRVEVQTEFSGETDVTILGVDHHIEYERVIEVRYPLFFEHNFIDTFGRTKEKRPTGLVELNFAFKEMDHSSVSSKATFARHDEFLRAIEGLSDPEKAQQQFCAHIVDGEALQLEQRAEGELSEDTDI